MALLHNMHAVGMTHVSPITTACCAYPQQTPSSLKQHITAQSPLTIFYDKTDIAEGERQASRSSLLLLNPTNYFLRIAIHVIGCVARQDLNQFPPVALDGVFLHHHHDFALDVLLQLLCRVPPLFKPFIKYCVVCREDYHQVKPPLWKEVARVMVHYASALHHSILQRVAYLVFVQSPGLEVLVPPMMQLLCLHSFPYVYVLPSRGLRHFRRQGRLPRPRRARHQNVRHPRRRHISTTSDASGGLFE
mmetsp:Transcript_20371/g.36344  ORF Transcript_20371/g.36344 Transcript_20371/m.36344 type:complete len:247 (+) Transcript_20371:29-769(+)